MCVKLLLLLFIKVYSLFTAYLLLSYSCPRLRMIFFENFLVHR